MAADGGPGMKVLVVDDDNEILRTAQAWLAENLDGVLVLAASDGPSALDLLRRMPCDVVVSDYKMPGMTGLEMLAEARKLDGGSRFILMTANRDISVATTAVNEHLLDAYLLKPVDPYDLLSATARALKGALEARVSKAISEKEHEALRQAEELVRQLRAQRGTPVRD